MTLAYKQKAAAAALEEIPPDCRLGVGAGSTVNCLIDLLPGVAGRLRRIVAASEETARRLERAGLHCCGLDAAGGLDLCIDGADEADDNRQLISCLLYNNHVWLVAKRRNQRICPICREKTDRPSQHIKRKHKQLTDKDQKKAIE